jgi:hypothetical protein
VVAVPGARQPFEVLAITAAQAIDLVAEALGRRVRLIPNRFGEPGEVWRIRACNDVIIAPTIYQDAAP